MHIGQCGVVTKYYMSDGSTKVEVQNVNENIGVYFVSDLKSSKQLKHGQSLTWYDDIFGDCMLMTFL